MGLRTLSLTLLVLCVWLSHANKFEPVPYGVPPPPLNPFAEQRFEQQLSQQQQQQVAAASPNEMLMDSYSNGEDMDYDEPTPAFAQLQQQQQQALLQQQILQARTQQPISLAEEASRASSLLSDQAQSDLARHMDQIVNNQEQPVPVSAPPADLPPLNERRAPSAEQVYDGSGYDIAPLNLPPPEVFVPPSPAPVALIQQQEQQQPPSPPQEQQPQPDAEAYRALASEERFSERRHRHHHHHHHHHNSNSNSNHKGRSRTRHHKKSRHTARINRHHDLGRAVRFRSISEDDGSMTEDNSVAMPRDEDHIEEDRVDERSTVDDGAEGDSDGGERSLDMPYGFFSTQDPDHPYHDDGEHLNLPSHEDRLDEIMELASFTKQQLRLQRAQQAMQQQQQMPEQQEQPRMISPVMERRIAEPPALEPLPQPPVVVA